MTQAEINAMVQRNVDHLEIILAYTATDSTPDIVGAADNLKTTHVAAITTGTDYITANTQENNMVQRNADHISTILVYAPVDADDDTPDVAGSSENKTSYTAAVTTGNAYIAANS